MDNKTAEETYHQLRQAVFQQNNFMAEMIDLTNNDSKLDSQFNLESEGSTIVLVDEVKPYKNL
jgi:hypothetical protein